MSGSLRLRLAVWYAVLLGFILAVASLFSYSFHSTFHYEDVDRSLAATAGHVLGELRARGDPPGTEQGIELPPVDEYGSPDVYVRLFDAEGRILAFSGNAGRQAEVDPRSVETQRQVRGMDSPLGWLPASCISPWPQPQATCALLPAVAWRAALRRQRLAPGSAALAWRAVHPCRWLA